MSFCNIVDAQIPRINFIILIDVNHEIQEEAGSSGILAKVQSKIFKEISFKGSEIISIIVETRFEGFA